MKDTDTIETLIEARLGEVADEIFGPSTSTLSAVALGGESVVNTLPAALQERLKSPPLARRVEILRNTLYAVDEIDRSPFLSPLPRGLRPPARGEIRVVDSVDVNDPTNGRRHTEPVLVLLDRQVSHHPDAPQLPATTWQAWTVSPYVGFAGHWDVLLQGDDVPRACGMVQVWNVVNVLDRHLGVCRLRLSAEQMAHVHAVWTEFISGGQEPAAEFEEDTLRISAGVRATPSGVDVVTGSPSTGPEDPRFMFQRFYVMIREALSTAYRHELRIQAVGSFNVAAFTETAVLLARCMLPGLHDGTPKRVGATRSLESIDRLHTDSLPFSKPESSWVEWGGYSSAEKRLSLGLLRERLGQLSPEVLAYEFLVAVKGSGPKLPTGETPEELIKVKGIPFEYKGTTKQGIFVLESHYPVVLTVLAGKVDLDIEVFAPSESSYLIRVTIRAA